MRIKPEQLLEVKKQAAALLLSVIESRQDEALASRILLNINTRQLVLMIYKLYAALDSMNAGSTGKKSRWKFQKRELEDLVERDITCVAPCACPHCRRDVGHSIYVLAVTLARRNPELGRILQARSAVELADENMFRVFASGACTATTSTKRAHHQSSGALKMVFDSHGQPVYNNETDQRQIQTAMAYYSRYTDSIEIFRHGQLEQVYFPIPAICTYLNDNARKRVFLKTEVDEQGSKVTDFYERVNNLFEEMKWQKQLKSRPRLYTIAMNYSRWKMLAVTMAVLQNVLVACSFPFDKAEMDVSLRTRVLTLVLTLLAGLSSVISFQAAHAFGRQQRLSSWAPSLGG